MEDTLFSLDARRLIDELNVCPTQRIVTDYWIVMDGHRFDANDVHETLVETCEDSGSYITDRRMVEALKKLGVLQHGGSSSGMSAAQGPNYAYFMERLRKQIRPAEARKIQLRPPMGPYWHPGDEA